MTAPLKKSCLLILLAVSCSFLLPACKQSNTPAVLVFIKTKGWHHNSIAAGTRAIIEMGKKEGFNADTTSDAAWFTESTLKKYNAVIFLNTTGNVLNAAQQNAFERYIQAGGGFAGIHSATDTEYDWPWYGKLVGARFASHPLNPGIRKATVTITDTSFITGTAIPTHWEREDEWYNFTDIYPDLKVVVNLDETTYDGGLNGSAHPITWYHHFDGGRAFYTAMGHTAESYTEARFLQLLSKGIHYAIGGHHVPDYTKAYATITPDPNRFVKTVLKEGLNAPMELAITNDEHVFFSEMPGDLSVYTPANGHVQLVHHFAVTTTGGMGLLGISLDPGFDHNRFIYVYYAPGGQSNDSLYFTLSRFTLTENFSLDTSTEKVMLRVPVQEKSGSHHGGSMAWDKAGNLFLSTGDGTTPAPAEGYAPLDERPGKEFYDMDSQRGAGNTNDFKGKILRIHPEKDGAYTIPPGNLFPPGTAKTKPEIYIMGVRNPYRIAVNPRSSILYWGDIGPDAGTDSERGPRGYDEFNQARKAGNFGWPYFVANNQAYAHWDFAKKKAGPRFNALHPENHSPNNTGLAQLPPAMGAMIWYPYAPSPEFPEFGLGGRSAMAGAFYEYKPGHKSNGSFPAYYNNKLFVFDWMRNWVMSLEFDAQENYVRSEPFMAGAGDFRRPIDLAFARSGVMYMLEYGSVYGAANPDARLVKISYYTGNRTPKASAGIVDTAAVALRERTVFLTSERKQVPLLKKLSGKPPLTVTFTAAGSTDLDEEDAITYRWFFDEKNTASQPETTFTYTRPGVYQAILEVKDKAGLSACDTVLVTVGNTAPQLDIISQKNTSFYFNNQPFAYNIHITDAEDALIDPARIRASYRYQPAAANITAANGGDQSGVENGESIISNSDCKSCHQKDTKLVGPSYRDIAKRYYHLPKMLDRLATKIITGGAGNWGDDLVMSAHPQLTVDEARQAVKYILSLNNATPAKASQEISIPLQGKLILPYHPEDPDGQYIFTASYTDGGNGNIPALTTQKQVVLKKSVLPAVAADGYYGFSRFRNSFSEGPNKSYLYFKQTDLSSLKAIVVNYSSQDADGQIQLRIDSKAGPVISTVNYPATGDWNHFKNAEVKFIKEISGKHDLYLFFIRNKQPDQRIIKIREISFTE